MHSLCIMLLTTLQKSSMLQGSGATDACDAGCAQHWVYPIWFYEKLSLAILGQGLCS